MKQRHAVAVLVVAEAGGDQAGAGALHQAVGSDPDPQVLRLSFGFGQDLAGDAGLQVLDELPDRRCAQRPQDLHAAGRAEHEVVPDHFCTR
nr:hypothetical protein [Streptomyces sp. NRRL S-1824]